MARRIRIAEWPTQLEAVEVAIKARWPWLATHLDPDRHQLHIEAEDHRTSGTVFLDSIRGTTPGVMVARCQMSGGGGIIGTLSEAEDAMFCCRAVLDALHRAQAMLGKLEVYAFDIPCLTCKGDGKVKKTTTGKGKSRTTESITVTCESCAGTGNEATNEASDT